MDIASLREKIAATSGKRYWRCLEELADDPEFEAMLARQFPGQATWASTLDRRKFLTLIGASLALSGVAGCAVQPPAEVIVPYVKPPDRLTPGVPLFFATAMSLAGETIGLLVESHEGRPTKIEGNPDHPASLGATDIYAQAAILGLYDPDRSQVVMSGGQVSTWPEAVAALRTALDQQRTKQGVGVRLLTGNISSPTLAAQIRAVLAAFPAARWHQFEAAPQTSAREGARLAFGREVTPIYHFDRADRILALDADFLAPPSNVRHVRQFIDRRRVTASAADAKQAEMNRLYVVESSPSITGAKADHRWSIKASQVESFARAVAGRLDSKLQAVADSVKSPIADALIETLARDLKQHGTRSLVLAGDRQPAAVHALAHAMNSALGAIEQTVTFIDPIDDAPPDQMKSLVELTDDMAAGRVELLVILDVNAASSTPADCPFAAALAKVPLSVHLGLYRDETAAICKWHIPEAHFLEAWSDARTFDGTASIVQPLIAPLYEGRSAHELVQLLVDPTSTPPFAIVQDYWRRHWESIKRAEDFEIFWETAVHDGIVPDTAAAERTVTFDPNWSRALAPPRDASADERPSAKVRSAKVSEEDLEIVFATDPTIFDGRFANSGWLQELPKPLTKLTWDNAAIVSPKTAERLQLTAIPSGHGGEHGQLTVDLLELTYRDRKLQAPAWIVPGQPDGSIALHLGYGRTRAGRVGTGLGFNANLLRTTAAPWFDHGLQVRKTGEQTVLACTQYHHRMEDRHLARSATLSDFQGNPTFAKNITTEGEPKKEHQPLPTLYPPAEHQYHGYKWGMAIDLTACIGCNACVVACQAENNIPVVGKDQVMRGREMHWLRIDRYYHGSLDEPDFHFQPVPCMHCENAPCELVCPVEATVHSDEGLNDMVYNRCVGTRYCSNNCPYKVRRFNFLPYSDFTTPTLAMMYNPEVTVRSRGVMEKCTYCVQRITRGRIAAEKEDRRVRDGEVLTACQAVCPARAISFGDLNDKESDVVAWKQRPLEYALLEELNTAPRTTYLAELRNSNPEIATE